MEHSEVEDAKTSGVESMGSAVVVPMSRKARDMGHPHMGCAIGRQQANGRPGPPAFGSQLSVSVRFVLDRTTLPL